MRRGLGIALAAMLALVLWIAFVATGTREGWWRPLPAPRGDTAAFIAAAKARFNAESKGNFAMALLKNGRVAGTLYLSHAAAGRWRIAVPGRIHEQMDHVHRRDASCRAGTHRSRCARVALSEALETATKQAR